MIFNFRKKSNPAKELEKLLTQSLSDPLDKNDIRFIMSKQTELNADLLQIDLSKRKALFERFIDFAFSDKNEDSNHILAFISEFFDFLRLDKGFWDDYTDTLVIKTAKHQIQNGHFPVVKDPNPVILKKNETLYFKAPCELKIDKNANDLLLTSQLQTISTGQIAITDKRCLMIGTRGFCYPIQAIFHAFIFAKDHLVISVNHYNHQLIVRFPSEQDLQMAEIILRKLIELAEI